MGLANNQGRNENCARELCDECHLGVCFNHQQYGLGRRKDKKGT